MTAENNQQPEAEVEVSPAGEGVVPEAAETAESSEVEALRAQVNALKEQYLRTQADMQNLRRRAEQDVEKAHKFALEKFVRELLPVVDSLEKSLEATTAGGDVLPVLKEGVEMTLSVLLSSLRKFSVEEVEAANAAFNPQMHEAMSMVPVPNVEPNTVVAVVQKGYTLNGRLVRPAMVVVSRPSETPKVDTQA